MNFWLTLFIFAVDYVILIKELIVTDDSKGTELLIENFPWLNAFSREVLLCNLSNAACCAANSSIKARLVCSIDGIGKVGAGGDPPLNGTQLFSVTY